VAITATYLSNHYIETATSRQLLNIRTRSDLFDCFVMRINTELAALITTPHEDFSEKPFALLFLGIRNRFDNGFAF